MKAKKILSTLLGTAALAAFLSLPILARTAPVKPGDAVSVDGQIQHVKVDQTKGNQRKALAVVTMSGQLYLLKPDASFPKAFAKANRVADKDDWYKVRGVVSKKDGTLALTVSDVREAR
jgi:hypothetical protein